MIVIIMITIMHGRLFLTKTKEQRTESNQCIWNDLVSERKRETIGHLITKNKMRNVTWKWWYKPEIYFRFHCFSLSLRFFFERAAIHTCRNPFAKSICWISILVLFDFQSILKWKRPTRHRNNKKTYHKLWNFRFEQKNKKTKWFAFRL